MPIAAALSSEIYLPYGAIIRNLLAIAGILPIGLQSGARAMRAISILVAGDR